MMETWNRYAYVLNNPLSNVDPDGLDCVYLNDAGDDVESIDHNSNAGECSGNNNGGYWVPGTVANSSWVTNIDQNNNQIGAFSQFDNGTLGWTASTSDLGGGLGTVPIDVATTPVPLGLTDDSANSNSLQVIRQVAQLTAPFTKAVDCGVAAGSTLIPIIPVNRIAGAPTFNGLDLVNTSASSLKGTIDYANKGEGLQTLVHEAGSAPNLPVLGPFLSKASPYLGAFKYLNAGVMIHQCITGPALQHP